MFKGINQIEFSRKFQSANDCYQYLVDYKWGHGFKCTMCLNTNFYKGKTWHHRRCRKCLYDESVTAHTIFHDLKMPVLKAFQMAFRIAARKKGMSTVELSVEVGVQQKTAWFFKRKLQIAMQSGRADILKTNVEMDETLIGGYSEGKIGRNHDEKEAVMVAIERLEDGRTGNIGLRQIEGFEKDTFEQAVDEMVDKNATITTDEFRSWIGLKKSMPNLKTKKSEKGKVFKEIHQQIMLVKMWLRGIHHKCSDKFLQGYLDEYAFRFNNRNQRYKIFDLLVSRMMHLQPQPFKRTKRICACNT